MTGASLGGAVAGEDAQAELVEPLALRLLLDRFRAREHVAQRAEVVRVAHLPVALEEAVGAEDDRGVAAVDQLRDDPVVQRRGVHVDGDAAQHRQEHGAGEAEAVEHRQGVEHLVELVEVDPGADLGAVGEEIAVAQHDPLGPALRARGEQDHRRILVLDAAGPMDAAGEQTLQKAAQPVAGGDLVAQVLQPQELGVAADRGDRGLQLGLAHELAGRDHQPDLRGDHRRLEVGRAGREIEHGRHPAEGLEREEGDRGGIDVGDEHADRFAGLGPSGELAPEHQSAGHQLHVVEVGAAGVLDHGIAPAVPPPCAQQRREQGRPPIGSHEHHVGHDVVELQVRDLTPGFATQLGSDRELARGTDRDGDLGEPVARDLAFLQPAERRQLGPSRRTGRIVAPLRSAM